MEVDVEIMRDSDKQERSRETYRKWKTELAKKGKTPIEVVEYYRSIGMPDYANELAEVIKENEDRT